ncbi:hypothetical protein PR202_ga11248 [Eleusine coracana subsp. coracana]|uniref:Uncharacterized protein n=1 Tax=Eleusine coracana subsp. coracana TaxID=191504 RepID=A0AAV5C926_ELECO|nr:hypothetical protein PR202_ga11248 [Eleusine coracana subsp. coracana]
MEAHKHNNGNNIQNLEPCRGEKTTNVAFRKSLSHPKQKRTPTAMVQSKLTAVTQTAADHEVPSEVPRQSKKRRVFVRSVSDLLKYAKREPSSGRSTSMLSSIIGKSLAGSPILSSSVRVDSRTSSGSVQRMKDFPHVENSSKSPENKAEGSNTVLKTPPKVFNDLSPTFSPVNPSKASSRSFSKTSVAKELLKLDPENALSNQRRKDSRRRKDMEGFSILFSHHLDEDVITCQKKVTVFLCSTFYSKTAFKQGNHDDEICLQGKRVFITPKVKPSREVVISFGQSIIWEGVSVFNSELLLNGIIIQKLEYERFITDLELAKPESKKQQAQQARAPRDPISPSPSALMKISVHAALSKNLNIAAMAARDEAGCFQGASVVVFKGKSDPEMRRHWHADKGCASQLI